MRPPELREDSCSRCGACKKDITPDDMVLKPPNTVGMFHVKCFTCSKCCRQLEAGEEFYTIDNKEFLCSRDFKNEQRSDVTRPGEIGIIYHVLFKTINFHDFILVLKEFQS